MIAVGVSAGGFASVALTADPPLGLAAAISIAGGRGSRASNDVCDEDALVHAFGVLGKTSRTPMLWVYAQNDKLFAPTASMPNSVQPGRAELSDAPSFGNDGHFLFSAAGASIWIPIVDRFLREQNPGTRDLNCGADHGGTPATAGTGHEGPRWLRGLSPRRTAQGFCRAFSPIVAGCELRERRSKQR